MSSLADAMRPTKLAEVIGQDATKRAIQSFIEKGNFPNVFLFYGPPGTGKTTLAQIVAEAAGGTPSCIHEINASTENKVENARALEEMAQSEPFDGKRRVFILNEFHRFTDSAQDALKDPMEKTNALWILTTDSPDKISAAILSRAKPATFKLNLLNKEEIWELLNQASVKVDPTATTMFLLKHDVRAPREILGVVDQLLAGVPLEETLHGTTHEPLYKDVAGAVLSGNWTRAATALSQIKTADSRGLIAITSAFFRQELLKLSLGPRADSIAACLVGMDQTGFADGVAYGAVTALLYKCCKALNYKETK
jgi:DNA polymerase III gamma/tau subunit